MNKYQDWGQQNELHNQAYPSAEGVNIWLLHENIPDCVQWYCCNPYSSLTFAVRFDNTEILHVP